MARFFFGLTNAPLNIHTKYTFTLLYRCTYAIHQTSRHTNKNFVPAKFRTMIFTVPPIFLSWLTGRIVIDSD
jgi:hypothetical protein